MIHGNIFVDEQEIGDWAAFFERTTEDGGKEYSCSVIGYDHRGHPYSKIWSMVTYNEHPLMVSSDIMKSAWLRLNV